MTPYLTRSSLSDMFDELYEDAVKLARFKKHISASILQCTFRIGYTRATAIIDDMKKAGVVDRNLDFVAPNKTAPLFK